MPKEIRTFIPVVKYFNDDDSEIAKKELNCRIIKILLRDK